jgi:NAD(P)-dependent dehydrogenase (short-subunit alcohol dehydrogenase family)
MPRVGTDPLDFAGRVVMVTGGGRGVGRGITERFLATGAEVVVCSRSEPDTLPDRATFVPADVRDSEQVAEAVHALTERFGRLDILVNNAGGAPPADSSTASPRFAEKIIALNLTAPLVLAQRANAVMQHQDEGGSIVNITSIAGTRPTPGAAAYGAAKAGLLNLTETLAAEWAPKVRVNAIVAGMVHTEKAELHYGDEVGIAAVAATVPMGRLAEPADIGDACLFLASPLARYVTGAHLALHGGGERPTYLDALERVRGAGS